MAVFRKLMESENFDEKIHFVFMGFIIGFYGAYYLSGQQ
jgi:hypothetical protein